MLVDILDPNTMKGILILISANLFHTEDVHHLRLAVTKYPPAILNIIERAEERMKTKKQWMELTVAKIEEMRDKRLRAVNNPSLMEEWAPSRVLYSKSLLPR